MDDEAVTALRLFVAEHFDGSLSRCIELDRLLWEVRLSQRHIPEMLHYEGRVAPEPKLLNHLDLADLGL